MKLSIDGVALEILVCLGVAEGAYSRAIQLEPSYGAAAVTS